MRFGSLYGKRAPETNSIYKMIFEAIEKGKINREGDGNEVRDYINVLDAARACYELLFVKSDGDYVMITGNQTYKIKEDEIVYDLYTGTGTIAKYIAKSAKKVVGIDSVEEGIKAAYENAKRNNINNCTFYTGDMKNIFTDEFIVENGVPDIIITDPPRDGMHKKVVEQILKIKAKRIVYVSCNSATQARDLSLMDQKYKVTYIQPVDMFPQTHHLENIVVLELK